MTLYAEKPTNRSYKFDGVHVNVFVSLHKPTLIEIIGQIFEIQCLSTPLVNSFITTSIWPLDRNR